MPIYLDDKRLARNLLAGDERAFLQFFDENFPRLYRFARARMPNDPEALQEVVQAALARGLMNISSYRGEAALFTWLCVICRRELANWMRRNARHAEHLVLSEDHPEVRGAVDSLTAPPDHGPDKRYRRHETARLIQVALDSLPAHHGDALEWKYIEGRSVSEIANRLEISVEAAQSLLARARRGFRDAFETLASAALAPDEAWKAPP